MAALLEHIARVARRFLTRASGPAQESPHPEKQAEARVDGTCASADVPALPLGARLRPRTGDYSISIGLMQDVKLDLQQVPPLPQAMMQVVRELDAGGSDAASVAAALAHDPVMAAALLRITNSSALGLRRPIVTLSEAVAYLGFSTSKALFLRMQMGPLFPPSDGGYDSGKLWAHSIAVSQAAEELAVRIGRTDPQLALTAGLLHDIGKLVLNSRWPQKVRLLWDSQEAAEDLLSRERRIFGADHAAAGAELAQSWKLPGELSEMIRLHHLPAGHESHLPPEPRRALLCVFVANQLVKYRHVYCDGMEIDPVSPEIAAELGLASDPASLLDERLCTMIDRAAALGGASAPSPASQSSAERKTGVPHSGHRLGVARRS